MAYFLNPTSVGYLFGGEVESYLSTPPPPICFIPKICNLFSHINKSGLFERCSEIRLTWPNSVNKVPGVFLYPYLFIISLYLHMLCCFLFNGSIRFNIICRVSLFVFCSVHLF